MKSKSVSVQNLENLVRQTIDITPKSNAETDKFQQMIYKKWYFKKLFDSKDMKSEQNYTKPQIISEQNVSTTVTNSTQPNYKRRINPLSANIKRPRTCVRNVEQENSNVFQNVRSLSPKNTIQNSNLNSKDLNVNQIQFLSDVPPKIIDHPCINDDNKVIQIWNYSKQRTNGSTNARNDVPNITRTHDGNDRLLEQQPKVMKKMITFEDWKRNKTIAYRKILKQLKTEEQQKTVAILEDMERKKAIRQAQILYRRQQQHRRARSFPSKHFMKPKYDETKEKQVVEQSINGTLKNQKQGKFGKGTTEMAINRKSKNIYISQKKQLALMQNSVENVIFSSWLDQLNWVLHKKYLRERRHLVRSLYCQPLYYGDATLYIT